MSQAALLHAETTEAIIKSFYYVYNTLGYGFLEKVYENSMRIALEKTGHGVEQQLPIDVFFEGEAAGKYFADLLVDNKVVVELKAAQAISPDHEAQLLNYLKATGHQVGLLLNFGPKAEFRRKVFTNVTT
ncbi:MAG: GxxExxY protein [Planctomycetes bacterium]|nr:GxxExxY protein [Planctomycetota bacterium]